MPSDLLGTTRYSQLTTHGVQPIQFGLELPDGEFHHQAGDCYHLAFVALDGGERRSFALDLFL